MSGTEISGYGLMGGGIQEDGGRNRSIRPYADSTKSFRPQPQSIQPPSADVASQCNDIFVARCM